MGAEGSGAGQRAQKRGRGVGAERSYRRPQNEDQREEGGPFCDTHFFPPSR